MNRSPEDKMSRPSEAELEDRIRRADRISDAPSDATSDATLADPELAADHALRRELRGLAEEDALPADLRRAVLQGASRTTHRQGVRWPGLPVAMAAGLAGLIALAVVLRPVEPDPAPALASTASADELKLALATIDRTSRRAMNVAGREVGEHLAKDLPRFEIERLPFGRLLTSFRIAPPRTHQPEED